MNPREVIIEPVVSEKSYALMADGKYTFRVDDRAHKTQIRHAVEEIFDVGVADVIGHQSLVLSQEALKVLQARASDVDRSSSGASQEASDTSKAAKEAS